MRGVFVTGTDTGIGKTVVSAALMAHSPRAHYWKPVQTGIEQDDDAAEVARLSGAAVENVRCYRLPKPVSPHLASRWAGVPIDLDWLTSWDRSGTWVVEGAGGALVPLTPETLTVELIARLGLPALVASRTTLGTINHTLLTLEALRRRDIVVAGVVMVGDPNSDNREAIEHYGRTRVTELPRFVELNRAALLAWTPPAWLRELLA